MYIVIFDYVVVNYDLYWYSIHWQKSLEVTFMLKRLRDGFTGFILGILLLSSFGFTVAAATNSSSIKVFFTDLKYYIDGAEKQTPKDQSGFIYKGTTYVPLRFISEALGEEVGWDGKTNSIYVGEQPSGEVIRMEAMKTHTLEGQGYEQVESFTTNTGEVFTHGYFLETRMMGNSHLTPEYVLNGKYKKFEAYLAPEERWTQEPSKENIGSLKIYGDGKLLYDSGPIASDILEPVKVNVDLAGVLMLKVDFSEPKGLIHGSYLGLLEPRFIK